MSEIKLFRMNEDGIAELKGHTHKIEKALQAVFENHLDTILGVRFLRSEYQTSKSHGGRMDTIGIDENNSPVIIEYKRSQNENVINQGLFYLDWLLDHKADFNQLVAQKLGDDVADTIDWSAPRLVCIAGDFNRYDEHAVNQISRNIDLLRYRVFGDDLLALELVHSAVVPTPNRDLPQKETKIEISMVENALSKMDASLMELYEALRFYLSSLGDDVQEKQGKLYISYRRIKNFACIVPQQKKIFVDVSLDPDSVSLEKGFTRDMRGVGHYGTGNLQVTLVTQEDLTKAQPLFLRAYEGS